MIKSEPLCNPHSGSHWPTLAGMNNYATVAEAESENGQLHSARPAAVSTLHLVTHYDLENLRSALAKGILPPDFESKLAGLARQSLLHQFVEQNCRLFVALLLAAQEGSFTATSEADRARLLRVLAYVRKDDDAIADY